MSAAARYLQMIRDLPPNVDVPDGIILFGARLLSPPGLKTHISITEPRCGKTMKHGGTCSRYAGHPERCRDYSTDRRRQQQKATTP